MSSDSKLKKVVRDPVHGYIKIETDIMSQIIDTEHFQRLRRIEQTNMRCVYPSARHDRFIHSIGTYHLAKTAVKALIQNAEENIKECSLYPNKDILKCLFFNFEIAALLHDVGHAPFSHTLEAFFAYQKVNNELFQIQEILIQRMDKSGINYSQNFIEDLKFAKPNPHEVVSCIVIADKFKNIIENLGQKRNCIIDFEFIFRCILGAPYSTTLGKYRDFRNCIIQLLNSATIDIDKLDYITRDSQISGYDNIVIDTKRLLESLNIVLYKNIEGKEQFCIVFEKQAISIIHNVLDARNSLYLWIYAHHKVKYEAHMIEKSLYVIAEKEKKDFLYELFSIEQLEENLLCDDNIWQLFQKHKSDSIIQELFCRNQQKKALWKSFAEFQILFATETEMEVGAFSLIKMRKFFEEYFDNKIDNVRQKEDVKEEFMKYLETYFGNHGITPKEYEIVFNKIKLSGVIPNTIIVRVKGRLFSFDSLIKDIYKDSKVGSFFYLYISQDKRDDINMQELVTYIKSYSRFKIQPEI